MVEEEEDTDADDDNDVQSVMPPDYNEIDHIFHFNLIHNRTPEKK